MAAKIFSGSLAAELPPFVQVWSPAPYQNVTEHAHACTHAQEAQMCTQSSNVFGSHFEALPD